MDYLSRKIGFYYKTKEWKDKLFQEILSGINPDAIARINNCFLHTEIFLKDGAFIKFLSASDSARGYKWHECFIEPTITYDNYCRFISPNLIFGGKAFVVEEPNDVYFRTKAADNYYESKITPTEAKG